MKIMVHEDVNLIIIINVIFFYIYNSVHEDVNLIIINVILFFIYITLSMLLVFFVIFILE
jgi:hypothetical protein